MKLQQKPNRKSYDTPDARKLVIWLKNEHKNQAYWAAIKEMIKHSINRNRDKCQIAIDAALLLSDEGYNKYKLEGDEDERTRITDTSSGAYS